MAVKYSSELADTLMKPALLKVNDPNKQEPRWRRGKTGTLASSKLYRQKLKFTIYRYITDENISYTFSKHFLFSLSFGSRKELVIHNED